MSRPKKNLALEEAELKKIEDLNRRKKKALEEQAEILRQERELEDAANGDGGGSEAEMVRGTEFISDKMAKAISSLEEDGKFWVFRIDDKGRSSQCGTWPIADWPTRMEEIAHEAGGGTFKIQFKKSDGTFVGQQTVSFDEKFYKRKEEPAQAANAGLFQVLTEIQRSNAAAQETSRRDMMEMMKLIVAGMSKGPNYSEIAELGQIFKGDGGGGTAAVVKALETGLELGLKLGGDKEPPSSLDRIIETIGAPAAQILSRLAASPNLARRPATPAPVAPPRPVSELPAPGGEGRPASPPAENPVEKFKASETYRFCVPKLLEAARTGADPKEWADMICDMIPGMYHPRLLSIVEKPDLVEFLGSYEPEARNYAVWITKVRDEILALFPPEEGEEVKQGNLSMTPMPLKPDGKPALEVPAVAVQALSE